MTVSGINKMDTKVKKEVKLLVAENNKNGESLVCQNLRRAGIRNAIVQFKSSSELMDFLFPARGIEDSGVICSYLLLLELNGIAGAELDVLRRLKTEAGTKKVSVIIITAQKDSDVVAECRELGYTNYLEKPIVYESLLEVLRKVGLFLMIVDIPVIKFDRDSETEGK